MKRCLTLCLGFAVLAAASGDAQRPTMNVIAEQYVRLVLAMGVHEADYVDAYYGPPAWRTEVEDRRTSLQGIGVQTDALARQLIQLDPGGGPDDIDRLRHQYLTGQVHALRARVAMRTGRKMTFDDESKALYDAVAPTHPESVFTAAIGDLERLLPGTGDVRARLDAFRDRFTIPKERLDATFKAAIEGCRARTRRYIDLPKEESFSVEYVTNQSWSAYNWYQGGYHSVIQVNTDLPIRVDAAIDLACHEGYPGHHVYNVLLEKHLVRGRKWVEYSVYPLFSPQSLIAEGTANYGIELAFPEDERLRFEREVIFPAAGLDPSGVQQYYAVLDVLDRLAYAGNEAARRYIDGRITASGAADFLERFALSTRPRAEQRVRFFDQYRSYVINYNLGKDMVRDHVARRVGPAGDVKKRWDEFERLLSTPRQPSGLLGR